jgi:hypothetical protein
VHLYLEKAMNNLPLPHLPHLQAASDFVTHHEATRAGFVALALEKNQRATPYVAEARALKLAAMQASSATDLPELRGIEAGLLAAAGLSDKALGHLSEQSKKAAIDNLIQHFLAPAGQYFVEELVFRFLLTRGDSLGGAMRNVIGVLAQRKLTRALLSTLAIAGTPYHWQHQSTKKWQAAPANSAGLDDLVRGLSWANSKGQRTLFYNLNVPIVGNNIDFCLLNGGYQSQNLGDPSVYLALGELKGGFDPAGADEHWKTARSALLRIHNAFITAVPAPALFFVGGAVEKKMANEIFTWLTDGFLAHAANLNHDEQLFALMRWLVEL